MLGNQEILILVDAGFEMVLNVPEALLDEVLPAGVGQLHVLLIPGECVVVVGALGDVDVVDVLEIGDEGVDCLLLGFLVLEQDLESLELELAHLRQGCLGYVDCGCLVDGREVLG